MKRFEIPYFLLGDKKRFKNLSVIDTFFRQIIKIGINSSKVFFLHRKLLKKIILF